jgi:hypothetical protein
LLWGEHTIIIMTDMVAGGTGIMTPEFGTAITTAGDTIQDEDAKRCLSWEM